MEEQYTQGKQCPFPVKCCSSNKAMNLAVDDATAFNMVSEEIGFKSDAVMSFKTYAH